MKTLTPLLASTILLTGLILPGVAAQTRTPAKVVSQAPSDPEVKAIIGRVNAKLSVGKHAKDDFAAELATLDELIAAKRKTAPEGAAQAAYFKATLFTAVFKDYNQGDAMLTDIPTDFPGTYYASRAQSQLDALGRSKEADARYAVGRKFPDFAGADLAGKPLSLARFKGKVLLVDFWATWCGPCVRELPKVKRAYAAHHQAGFEIFGVSLDNDRKTLTDFIAQNAMPWPQHFDGKGWKNALAVQYDIHSIPATFLLDGEGTIIGRNLRGPALEAALAKALKK